jgi:sialic acid synthase SpsE
MIGGHEVGVFLSPYIIAEIGVNHEGDIGLAKKLIDQAAGSGAHAAKFQSYKANKIASKNSPAYWDLNAEPTESQFKLFQKYDMFGEDEYEQLARHCKKKNIHFLSTPFDLEAADFLDPLMPAYKIASADITNLPLIRRCAAKGKPLLMSTGASTLPEIEFAVQEARTAGAQDICLLHCVLNYPTAPERAKLAMINVLARTFPECVVGYSDHVVPDPGLSSLESALLLGASVLEKHFTHDKKLVGNDHYHAMDGRDLAVFCEMASRHRSMYGDTLCDVKDEHMARLHARRSVFASVNIKSGDVLSEDNLVAKRPGHGISPIHWDALVGRRVVADINEDQLISWADLQASDV